MIEVSEKEWNNLFWKELLKPTLIVASIPFIIMIIGVVYYVNRPGDPRGMLLVWGLLGVMFVIIMGLGAKGLDFKYRIKLIKR